MVELQDRMLRPKERSCDGELHRKRNVLLDSISWRYGLAPNAYVGCALLRTMTESGLLSLRQGRRRVDHEFGRTRAQVLYPEQLNPARDLLSKLSPTETPYQCPSTDRANQVY